MEIDDLIAALRLARRAYSPGVTDFQSVARSIFSKVVTAGPRGRPATA